MLVAVQNDRFTPANANIGTPPDPEPEKSPGFMATAGAALRQENLVGSLLSQQDMGDKTQDSDYDFTKGVVGTKYEPYIDRFATRTFNRHQKSALMRQIDMEEEDRNTLRAAGWHGLLMSMGAGVFSPENLIPFGGEVYRGARIGLTAGRFAKEFATVGALSAGVSELGLQSTQEIRPASDSAFAIGGSAVLGGILGGSLGAVVGRRELSRLGLEVDRYANEAVPDTQRATEDALNGAIAQSAGAAAVRRDSLEDLSVAGKVASAAAHSTAPLNPILRSLDSPSAVYRRHALALMENPIYLKKNFEGGASEPAVESLVKEYAQGRLATAVEQSSSAYREYRKAGGVLKNDAFRAEVGKAMRRSDSSADPHVQKAAEIWRREVFDPLKERAIETGLLPKDVSVETAASYFSRVYNRPKIEANEGAFKAVVSGWLDGEINKSREAVSKKLDRTILSLNSQKQEIEANILRRDEETRRRVQEGEIDLDAPEESSLVGMVKQVKEGKRPPEPQTLSQWLRGQAKNGIFDPGGDLLAIMPDAKNVPGLVRKTIKSSMNPRGGDSLDDVVRRAWEEGFLNESATVAHGAGREGNRPSIREFLDALDDDQRGSRIVRIADEADAATARNFEAVEEALSRMGVDLEKPLLSTTESMKDIVSKVNRVLADFDRKAIAALEKKIEDALAKHREDFPDFVNAADRQSYVQEIADDIFNTITGRNADGDLPRDIVAAKRGPLKERTFNIPDAMIEDFLESDVEAVGRRYTRMMAADVELQTKYGSTTLEPQLKEVRDDYQKLRESVAKDQKLTSGQKERRTNLLIAREKSDIRDMKAVRDMLRGTYMARENSSNFARVAAVAGTLNYLRAMGGVVLSSATDVARHVMVHGMSNVMKDGIGPLIRNMKAFKMSAAEGRRAGAVAERVLQSRMATWGEIIDPYSQNSPFERFLRNTATGFSHLTGMGYWNEFQKSFASVLTQSRILRGAADFSKVKPREKAYLAFLGIDEDMAARIAKEFDAHGSTEDGVRVAHTDDWTDDLARRTYRAAVNKDVDSTIVSKGVGDIPLFAHTPTGRMLIQFKSFALASHQRAFIRGMQEAPAGMISGTIMATTIGMMIYYLKAVEANRTEDISDNPGRWIAEGLDRSGMFAVAFEANNTIEKALGIGAYGALQSLFPDSSQGGKASRYMTRSTAAALTGPTGDFIDTLVKVTQGALDGDMKESDVNAIRRLAPFATLPGIRSLVEYMAMPAARQAAAD